MDFDEYRKKWARETAPLKDLLSSPQGRLLLDHLKKLTYGGVQGKAVYVPGSFDATAFNLGAIFVYEELERIAKGVE